MLNSVPTAGSSSDRPVICSSFIQEYKEEAAAGDYGKLQGWSRAR